MWYELESRMTDLGDACEAASSPEFVLASEYNLGLANGLRLALAIMTGREPKYIARSVNDNDR